MECCRVFVYLIVLSAACRCSLGSEQFVHQIVLSYTLRADVTISCCTKSLHYL